MAIQISPLTHIEIVVPDIEKAYDFLHNTFGARKVQKEAARFISSDDMKVIHVGLGDVVLQFVQPDIAIKDPDSWFKDLKDNSWYRLLKERNASVHNLTFGVDNITETAKALSASGISPLFSFSLDYSRVIPQEFLKPEVQPVYMMNTMDKIGCHLELAESFLKNPPEPAPTSRELIGSISPMLHIGLVTPDAEETYCFLNQVFGSEKVEQEFAGFLDTPSMKIVHVNLKDVVLQYCQPIAKQGSWYECLKARGPGVHNITFIVENLNDTMKKIEAAGAKDLFTCPLNWSELLGTESVKPNVPPVHMVDTMDILGFYLALAESPSKGKIDFLYKNVA